MALLATSSSRVATFAPLAVEAAKLGHECTLFAPEGAPSRIGAWLKQQGAESVQVREVERGRWPNEAALIDADIAFCNEGSPQWLPERLVRVVLHHSLPDNEEICLDYARFYRLRKPLGVAEADYLIVPSRLPKRSTQPESWKFAARVRSTYGSTRRGTPLTLLLGGYPKIDFLRSQVRDGDQSSQRDTVVYAPTKFSSRYGQASSHGIDIVEALLRSAPQHRVVFRPFPSDLAKEANYVDQLTARFSRNPRFSMDSHSEDALNVTRVALVVTDRSSVAVSFSLGTERPSIFLQLDRRAPQFSRTNVSVWKAPRKGDARAIPCGWSVGDLRTLDAVIALVVTRPDVWSRRLEGVASRVLWHGVGYSAHLAGLIPALAERETPADSIVIRPDGKKNGLGLVRKPAMLAQKLETRILSPFMKGQRELKARA